MTSAIEIKNLTVKLGDFTALENLNLSVETGDFVGILGPNGGGKSTLLKAILNLVQCDKGEISIFGKSQNEYQPELIGYVPQLKTLDRNFPAITCDLVASGMRRRWPGILTKKDHKQISEVLEMVGACHLCHKALGHLSGGEIQRVYLARALIRKPKILLLDEPATGIDAVGEDYMYKILDDYMKQIDVTVLMVTHDWLAARHHANKVLIINRKLITFGKPSESLDDEYLRAAFGHVGHGHHLHDHNHQEGEGGSCA